MIRADKFDEDDIRTLAAMLEREHKNHCQKRSICFWLFLFWFLVLVSAVGIAAYVVLSPSASQNALAWVQALTAVSAAAVSFFSMWWTVQNCINSIERALVAAQAGRHQLFASMLDQVQCADKEKRRVWLEIVKAAIT